VVTVLDGPDTGRRVNTDGDGTYRFDSLTIADVNFSATATGFQEDRRGTRVNGTNTLNFTLAPVAVPTAVTITSTIVSGGPGTPVQEWSFVATVTSPPSNITSYSWDFGDGGSAANSRANEQHVYTTKGNFTVTVTVNRASGAPIVGTLQITVS
jgi:PKD repeat protein